jgi:hypothetical protein
MEWAKVTHLEKTLKSCPSLQMVPVYGSLMMGSRDLTVTSIEDAGDSHAGEDRGYRGLRTMVWKKWHQYAKSGLRQEVGRNGSILL